MSENIFIQILNMSFTGSVVILFVLLARLFLKKSPKIFSYLLWSIVLFRLLCPFSFESAISLLPVNDKPLQSDFTITQNIDTGIAAADASLNQMLPKPNEYESANPADIYLFLFEMVWSIGIILILIHSAVSVICLRFKLKGSVKLRDNIYLADHIGTPFVMGFLCPKIYLPSTLEKSEYDYIILHEQTHIKRLDHITKLLAFAALCLHWFNPLVWIAFALYSKDMEMSCDESVMRRMDKDVRREYSRSLLELAAGRKIIAGVPLAFCESNTKSRIKNVMKYKKPALWAVLLSLATVLTICLGFAANPASKALTPEEYAHEYIDTVISQYNFEVIDSKITAFEKLAEFDSLTDYPIELWALEYRLKPNEKENVVLAGGMNEIDGWITEDSSSGKPILVFSYKKKNPQMLGVIHTIDMGNTVSDMESSLRILLESKGILPAESYKGKHVLVKFPLSTGETCQVLMSQPAVKGNLGIWCAERWMDGNGTIYYENPHADTTASEYYVKLQTECDSGHKPWLLDPAQTALEFIKNDLGQWMVSAEQLEVIENVTAKDFLKTPVSLFFGFISDINLDRNQFHLDRAEWITSENKKRLSELGISKDDLPNGFYIYNPDHYPQTFEFDEKTEFSYQYVTNSSSETSNQHNKDIKAFSAYLQNLTEDAVVPFWVTVKDGKVISVQEQYLP